MATRPASVGPDFVTAAPVRLVFARDISAAPEVVFRALADDTAGWTEWFTSVQSARALDDGASREIRLRGGGRFLEQVVARTPHEVYAYRVEETNAPGLRALLEEWRLTPVGDGTRVQWTIAGDGTALFRSVLRLARPFLAREFRTGVRALDRRLAPSGR